MCDLGTLMYDTRLSFFISKMRAHLTIQQNQKEKSISGVMEHTIESEEKGTKQKEFKQLFHYKIHGARGAYTWRV